VLTVGDLQPRKNDLGLLAAFEEVLRAHPHLPHNLVFVGQELVTPKSSIARQSNRPWPSANHFTGFVDDADMPYLYGACDLFIFPSFYEGFGLGRFSKPWPPAVQWLARIPRPCRKCGRRGYSVDPFSKAEMIRAIADVLLERRIAHPLERLGIARAAAFSWRKPRLKTLKRGTTKLAGIRSRAEAARAACYEIYLNRGLLAVGIPALPSLSPTHQLGQRLSAGEATLGSCEIFRTRRARAGDFDVRSRRQRAWFTVKDRYHSTANAELCSLRLEKDTARGPRKTRKPTPSSKRTPAEARNRRAVDTPKSQQGRAPGMLWHSFKFVRKELEQGRLAPRHP